VTATDADPQPALHATRRPHVAALDGIRGIGVGVVVVHHVLVANYQSFPVFHAGWVGVDVFFVLSGFLITATVIESDGRGLVGFLGRRFWRLAPALALLLAWFAVVSRNAGDQGTRMADAARSAAQVINVTQAAHPPFSRYLGHLWSLSAEVQFYVVWPLLLAWMLRRRLGRGLILLVPVGVFAASAVERWVMVDRGVVWYRLYFGPDTRVAGLAAGCVVGLLFAWHAFERSPILAPAAKALAVPALLAIGAYVFFGPHFVDADVYRWQLTSVVLATAVLVAAAASAHGAATRPVLEWGPLTWLGRVSYSVYLWHVPLIAVVVDRWPGIGTPAKAAIVIPATLVLAWASFTFVERPLLSATTRRRLVRSLRRRKGAPVDAL
jgi:peptidoglycan/LPS O-acetylase OafA/YrhL